MWDVLKFWRDHTHTIQVFTLALLDSRILDTRQCVQFVTWLINRDHHCYMYMYTAQKCVWKMMGHNSTIRCNILVLLLQDSLAYIVQQGWLYYYTLYLCVDNKWSSHRLNHLWYHKHIWRTSHTCIRMYTSYMYTYVCMYCTHMGGKETTLHFLH